MPTIAELLKPLGYATGQFGKNHLGDMNKYLPTVHGFDEFFGNLYHLNAEEEPEQPNWPSAEDFPQFNERFRPRGVIHSWATEEDDDTDEGAVRPGRQAADRGHGPADEEADGDDRRRGARARRSTSSTGRHAAGTPFFVWFNTTHMHFRTHPKPESVGQAGRWQSPYHDTMIDHDKVVGALLDKLDELGIAENTIVIYSTDNGPHMNTWPDAGMTPFRSEKNTNWEGAFRVPELIRWPGKIPAGDGVERDHPAPRLAADVPRRRRRAGHRREAEGGSPGRRHDLQGAHRRLQPAALPDRRGRQEPAAGARLLLGRR